MARTKHIARQAAFGVAPKKGLARKVARKITQTTQGPKRKKDGTAFKKRRYKPGSKSILY